LRKYYSDRTAFATAVLIGFSTGLWVLRDNIIGDFPAAVFILLTIVFLEKKKNIIDWKTFCTFALLIFINYVFRPTGLILFPAWVLFNLYKKQFKWKPAIMVFGFTAFLIVLQSFLIPNDINYITMLIDGYADKPIANAMVDIGRRLMDNLRSLAYITNTGDDSTSWNFWIFFNLSISCILGLFALIGLIKSKQISLYLIFGILYVLTVIIFPGYQILRYLIPLIPLYLYFIITGITQIKSLNLMRMVSLLLMVGITTIYIRFYVSMIPKYQNNRISDAETQEMIKFIVTNVNQEELVMCQRARAITLLTEKKTTSFPDGAYSERLENNINANEVKYILLSEQDYSSFPKEYIEQNSGLFTKIFENENFTFYRTNR